jgi:hypothetical protein
MLQQLRRWAGTDMPASLRSVLPRVCQPTTRHHLSLAWSSVAASIRLGWPRDGTMGPAVVCCEGQTGA